MEVENKITSFLKDADQPNHPWHRIHLLRNLRKTKNAIAEKNYQITGSEILQQMNGSEFRDTEIIENDNHTKLTTISEETPTAVDFLIGNRKSETPHVPNLSSFENQELGFQSGITFLNTIQLVGSLYDTSGDDSFWQQRDRLTNTLNMMKQNEQPDADVLGFKTEYERLEQEKSEIEQIFSF